MRPIQPLASSSGGMVPYPGLPKLTDSGSSARESIGGTSTYTCTLRGVCPCRADSCCSRGSCTCARCRRLRGYCHVVRSVPRHVRLLQHPFVALQLASTEHRLNASTERSKACKFPLLCLQLLLPLRQLHLVHLQPLLCMRKLHLLRLQPLLPLRQLQLVPLQPLLCMRKLHLLRLQPLLPLRQLHLPPLQPPLQECDHRSVLGATSLLRLGLAPVHLLGATSLRLQPLPPRRHLPLK